MSESTAPEVFEQDVPDGGSVDGHMPAAAAAVVPVGIVTTRTVPALTATLGALTFPLGGVPQRIGRDARRRRLILSVRSSVGAAYVVLAENAQQAASGYGFTVPAGTVLPPVEYSGELWIAAFGLVAATDSLTVGFFAEIEQG